MRKFSIALALLGLFFFAGCSSDSKESPKESAPKSSESASPVEKSPKDVYLDEIHREYPDQKFFTDDKLVQLAEGGCEALETLSVEQVFTLVSSKTESPEETKVAFEAVSEGIASFCPEHAQELVDAAR